MAYASSGTTVHPDATIDGVRRFCDQRPCNIRHSSEPIGTNVYFDQVEARKYMVGPHIPDFAEFPRWRGKKVLEVGRGIGTEGVNFARAGADYTGVAPIRLAYFDYGQTDPRVSK